MRSMEGLNIDNILEQEEIDNLFLEQTDTSFGTEDSDKDGIEPSNTDNKEEPTDVDIDNLFSDQQESVSSKQETNQEGENTDSEGDTSPKQHFYSAIAKALKEDGIFPDIEDSIIETANSAEKFANIIEQHIASKLDEKQKRIDDALNSGVDVSEVKKYEQALAYLDTITEDNITDEGDSGENLRKQLIFQDFVNRGYSKERASREVNKSFDSGSDIEDAKEALASNKEFFNSEYSSIIEKEKNEEKLRKKDMEKQSEDLKKSILEDSKIFGNITVDKNTRQKIYDSISKPIYKDKDTGEYLTEIQKYEKENKTDFLKNIGLLYTLTNGFKDINSFVKPEVTKAIKKGVRDLENRISNTNRTANGSLSFMGGSSEDGESFVKGNWDLSL